MNFGIIYRIALVRLSVSARLCGSNGGFRAPGKDGAVVVEVQE